jgi:hypothetical protein
LKLSGAGEARTPYLLTASQTFSQVNYGPLNTHRRLEANRGCVSLYRRSGLTATSQTPLLIYQKSARKASGASLRYQKGLPA